MANPVGYKARAEPVRLCDFPDTMTAQKLRGSNLWADGSDSGFHPFEVDE